MKRENLTIEATKYEDARAALSAAFKREDSAKAELSVSRLQQSHIYGVTRERVATELSLDVNDNDVAKATLDAFNNDRLTRQLVSDLWIVFRVIHPKEDGTSESGLTFSAALTLSKRAKLGKALKDGDKDAVDAALSAVSTTDRSVDAIRKLYADNDNKASKDAESKDAAEYKSRVRGAFVALFDAISADERTALAKFAATLDMSAVYDEAVNTELTRLGTSLADARERAVKLSDAVNSTTAALIAAKDALKVTKADRDAAVSAADSAAKLAKEAEGTPFAAAVKADYESKVTVARAAVAAYETAESTMKRADTAAKEARKLADEAAGRIKEAEKRLAAAKKRAAK